MTLERTITDAILRRLNHPPHTRAFKVAAGPMQGKGHPDIVGCHHGRMLALEVKRPGEQPTPLQRHTQRAWGAAGAIAGIVESVADVDQLLEAHAPRTETL